MKIFVTALALCLIAACAFGQATTPLAKGAWMVGGDAYFQSLSGDLYKQVTYSATDTTEKNQTIISFAPQVGYFFMPKVMVGLDFEFTSHSNFSGDNKQTTFTVAPTVGYYFNMDEARTDFKGAFVPYIRGFVGFGSIKEDFGDVPAGAQKDETNKLFTVGGQGGALFFFSNNVAADFALRVASDKVTYDKDFLSPGEKDSATGFNVKLGVGIQAFIF